MLAIVQDKCNWCFNIRIINHNDYICFLGGARYEKHVKQGNKFLRKYFFQYKNRRGDVYLRNENRFQNEFLTRINYSQTINYNSSYIYIIWKRGNYCFIQFFIEFMFTSFKHVLLFMYTNGLHTLSHSLFHSF